MDTIDLSEGFSIHDYRSGLKLLKQTDTDTLVANRQGFDCPVCRSQFTRLLETTARSRSLSTPSGPVCVARVDDKLLIFAH